MDMEKTLKQGVNKTKAAAQKTINAFDFMRGLSIKNKLNYDIQVKSDKTIFPLWRQSINFNKEFKIMPIIYAAMALMVMMLMWMPCKKKN